MGGEEGQRRNEHGSPDSSCELDIGQACRGFGEEWWWSTYDPDACLSDDSGA